MLQLAPLGALPEHQRRGHGSALARASLAALSEPWPPPAALHDWAFQVAVLDERAPLPQGQVADSAPFRG